MEAFLASMRDSESDSDGADEMVAPARRAPARRAPARQTDAELALQIHSKLNNMRYRPTAAQYTHGPGARLARLRQKQKNKTRLAEMVTKIASKRARAQKENKPKLAMQRANSKRTAEKVKLILTKNDPSKPASAAKQLKRAAVKSERRVPAKTDPKRKSAKVQTVKSSDKKPKQVKKAKGKAKTDTSIFA